MDIAENKNQNVTSAPPAPQEVKVRTMKSDLVSIAASGGGFPQFQNVPLAQQNKSNGNQRTLLTTIIVIIIVILVAAVLYFGYLAFQKSMTA